MTSSQNTLAGSKCSRCGKMRIVVSSEKEVINNSVIIRTITSCPDKECQAEVDKQQENERYKREQIQQATIERQIVRK